MPQKPTPEVVEARLRGLQAAPAPGGLADRVLADIDRDRRRRPLRWGLFAFSVVVWVLALHWIVTWGAARLGAL